MNSAGIRALLRQRYPRHEWALEFEVANGTGGHARRSADAVAMNLWPSRGLAIHGFEFKISRGDWLRELKTPEKAEPVAQYCDHWWIVAPTGVVKKGELPSAWGLMEVEESPARLIVSVEAPPKASSPVDRLFLAALFRRSTTESAQEIEDAVRQRTDTLTRELQSQFDARVKHEVDLRTRTLERRMNRLIEFEKAGGFTVDEWKVQPDEFGKAVQFVLRCELYRPYGPVSRVLQVLEQSQKHLSAVLADAAIAQEEQSEGARAP